MQVPDRESDVITHAALLSGITHADLIDSGYKDSDLASRLGTFKIEEIIQRDATAVAELLAAEPERINGQQLSLAASTVARIVRDFTTGKDPLAIVKETETTGGRGRPKNVYQLTASGVKVARQMANQREVLINPTYWTMMA